MGLVGFNLTDRPCAFTASRAAPPAIWSDRKHSFRRSKEMEISSDAARAGQCPVECGGCPLNDLARAFARASAFAYLAGLQPIERDHRDHRPGGTSQVWRQACNLWVGLSGGHAAISFPHSKTVPSTQMQWRIRVAATDGPCRKRRVLKVARNRNVNFTPGTVS